MEQTTIYIYVATTVTDEMGEKQVRDVVQRGTTMHNSAVCSVRLPPVRSSGVFDACATVKMAFQLWTLSASKQCEVIHFLLAKGNAFHWKFSVSGKHVSVKVTKACWMMRDLTSPTLSSHQNSWNKRMHVWRWIVGWPMFPRTEIQCESWHHVDSIAWEVGIQKSVRIMGAKAVVGCTKKVFEWALHWSIWCSIRVTRPSFPD